MNGYLYYNVTNRYYWSLLDTYHIACVSLQVTSDFPLHFNFRHFFIVYD